MPWARRRPVASPTLTAVDPTPAPPVDGSRPGRLARSGLRRPASRLVRAVVFVLLADALAWLVCLPLWTGGRGLAWPPATLFILAMMATPALAALLTARLLPDGRPLRTVLGLAVPWRRGWGVLVLAWLGPLALSAAAVALSAAAGTLWLDLRGFSGFVETLEALGPLPLPVTVLVALTLVQLLFAPFLNGVAAMGEELGWRGFLRDAARDRSRTEVVLVTGVVWGTWHAPVLLLGYNYPGVAPVAAVGLMVVFTTLLSALLEWLREASGGVVAPALAHGAVNASAGLALLAGAAGQRPDAVAVGLLGWPGWLLMAAAVLVLVLTRRLRPGARQEG